MSKLVVDQMLREVEVNIPAQRIISLVPSITELLYHLGLSDQVVGITKFCVHPVIKQNMPLVVGGTKNFRFDEIDKISPDLILANREENYKEGIELLEQKYPVWVSDVNNFKDAIEMINSIGQMVNRNAAVQKLVAELKTKWKQIKGVSSNSVLYFIWNDPKMVVRSNTFINSVLEHLGLVNMIKELSRYPELSNDRLSELTPDMVFLSSEPYPFKKKHIEYFQKIFPKSKIVLVDGEMFSWYGSRMLYAPDYIKKLVNHEI